MCVGVFSGSIEAGILELGLHMMISCILGYR